MKKNLLFVLLAIVLLTPWPVAYAYDNGLAEQSPVRIEAATVNLPGWTAYGSAIGGVSQPGDVFYVDTVNTAMDTLFTLHLTNAYELSHYYRYLILEIGIYHQDEAGAWEKLTSGNSGVFPDTYLTMRDGYVSFCLPGYTRYKLTVDGGSFYCYPAGDGADTVPRLYLSADEGRD
ncbi:hypothetical protein ACFLWN_04715 [Chloroflexota bacterium]